MTKTIKRPREDSGANPADRDRARATLMKDLVHAPPYRRSEAWDRLVHVQQRARGK